MKSKVLFSSQDHQWVMLGRDPSRKKSVVDTNEYIIVSGDEAFLTDPGGTEIFPHVLGAVAEHININQIKAFFVSHQDPDIMSSMPLWMGLTPEAKIYLSHLWLGFVAHFGEEYSRNFVAVPDEGVSLTIGPARRRLDLIPAHYMHSSGNFSLYDPFAKVLFSGDIGAAFLPDGNESLFVEDFNAHIRLMENFHLRWMPSNQAKNDWVKRVRQLDVDFLCPQHGAVFRGEQVGQFLDWLERLEVGTTRNFRH